MEQIKAYKTDDGKIFTTYEEAELHERKTHGLKVYRVDLSYDGYASVGVLAKNEDDAIKKARDQIYNEDIDFDFAGAKVELTED